MTDNTAALMQMTYLFVFLCTLQQSQCQLNFVSMYYGSAPSIGAEVMSTAYELTLEVLNKKYPLVFANYTYHSANASDIGNTCSIAGRESSVNFLANFYQQGLLERGQTILLAPVCPVTFAPIGDFAKELDVLAIACASPDLSFNNKRRYPSLLSFGIGDASGYTSTLVKLMRKLKWKSIAIVNDMLSRNSYAVRSLESCRPTVEYLRASREFESLEIKTDSIFEGFTRALYAASNFSRIILTCTLSLPMRQLLGKNTEWHPISYCIFGTISSAIMFYFVQRSLLLPGTLFALQATTADLRMISGDYVFIYFYGSSVPFEHMIQWNYNDTLDNAKILEALESVVVIRFPQFPFEILDDFTNKVQLRRFTVFGTPINPEAKYNEYLVGCYEAVESLAQILTESIFNKTERSESVISGRDLAKRFFNRTFALTARSVTISPFGARVNELEVQQFQNNTKLFVFICTERGRVRRVKAPRSGSYISFVASRVTNNQNVFVRNGMDTRENTATADANAIITARTILPEQKIFDFNDATMQFTPTENNVTWKLGIPPPDRPLCGVLNDRCLTSSFEQLAIGISFGAIALVSLVVVSMIRFVMWRHRQAELFSDWWKINHMDVSDMRQQNSQDVSVSNAENVPDVSELEWKGTRDGSDLMKRKVGAKFAVMSFLCISVPGLENEETLKNFVFFLHQLRNLIHPNVCGFIGLCVDTKPITVFEEFSGKGSLDQLISGGRLEWNLKLSLLKDLTEGLKHIHGSAIRLHGNLKSSSCYIDGYLGLKVGGTGQEQIVKLLLDNTSKSRFVTEKHIWMAPEILRSGEATQKSDLYSLGIIAHQILEECGPYHLDSNIPESLIKIENGDSPLLRPTFVLAHSANRMPLLQKLIASCWAEEPHLRPTSSLFRNAVFDFASREGLPGSLFDAIVRRLERYSATLEETVAVRTQQLKLEQSRCDELLADVLPREIVRVLRQGRNVIPELFDSATLFFSDIPEFAHLATISAPVDVMAFLHQLYSLFDVVITKYQVYKVETIADSYMVASGLPVRIGNKHVAEICDMALDLQVLVQQWSNPIYQSEKIQLRVGIHTGPVATAVIGKILPRYCLFGDTVNTASRMESHGEASKIHVSHWSKEIAVLAGFEFMERGLMMIKGKGEVVTYWLTAGPNYGFLDATQEKILTD